MGRLQDLLDELHARQSAERLADDTLAEGAWDDEGGAPAGSSQRAGSPERVGSSQRVADDSASRSAPSTSSGTTDSF